MSLERVIETDVLVIGAGMAGFFAALKARERGLDVTLGDKAYVGKAGGTHFAEGDILYFRPERGHQLKALLDLISVRCEYVNNRDWGEICLKESKDRFDDLVSWGIPFYQEDGKPYTFNYYGSSISTTYEDISMLHREYSPALRKKALEAGIRILDKIMFCELLQQDEQIVGAIGFNTVSGNLFIIHAKAVVIATGSTSLKAGNYPVHFWTGDGEAMAYRAGIEIASKEFMYGTPLLRSEVKKQEETTPGIGVSGEIVDNVARFPFAIGGGISGWFIPNLNIEGKPCVHPAWDAHCGRAPLYLDTSLWPQGRMKFLKTFFKRIGTNQPDKIDFDVFRGGKIQWTAARVMTNAIFAGSGIWPTDTNCAAGLPGLYAAGNSCATMASGATYAGMGWALNHAAVTGNRAGIGAAEYALKSRRTKIDEMNLKQIKGHIYIPLERNGGFSPGWVTQVLQSITVPYFVFNVKHEERMQAVLTLVHFINNHLVPQMKAGDAHEWRLAHETRNLALTTEMRLRASLFRKESRGYHFREDYPRRDDPTWLVWVKLKEEQGEMKVYKEQVPKKWWPDLSKPYEERYPRMLPLE